MSRRVLVAGVGNIFFGDDGFGVEVARRLASRDLPEGVAVTDFGIRGVHLAYELLDGYDTFILVDLSPRGDPPGTIYVIEPELDDPECDAAFQEAVREGESALIDAHGMQPAALFAMVKALGGTLERVLIVGCEPADLGEGMDLSEPVEAAVDEAVRVVLSLIEEEVESGNASGQKAKTGKEG
ncbi:MAG: hydrogenase maturation protease [Actinomycetota bacterium]